MKYIRAFFGMLAALLTACAVWMTVNFRGAPPILVSAPEEAGARVEHTMQALCAMEDTAAEQLLYEMPDLGLDREPEGTVNQMIWEAYRNSLDYEMVGQVYATGQGLAQKVKIISMELPTVTEKLGQRAQKILGERVDAAQDVSEVYDADNAYRETFVAQVLEEAVRQALEEDVRYTYQIVTVQLVCQDGQWWVKPDKALLNAVFGGIAG